MALNLVNSFNVSDNATLELDGASYVTTANVGGTTYVFVAGKFDNGISVFALGADGSLTNVDNVPDTALMNLGGAFALTTAVVGGTTYLFVSSISDYGISAFSVAADGSLTNVANVSDSATLQLALTTDVETMVVGGTTYLFAGGVNDNGLSVFSVGANGALTNVDNVVDDATVKIQGPQGLATAVVGGNAYLFVTGFHDDGVSVYSVAADGHLTNVFNVADSGPTELDGPVDAITAMVGGTTYLIVSGFEDDGLTVFSVAANGALTNVFNLPDNGTLELDNPVGLSTVVLGGTTYLFVAGADDDGISVFAFGADGSLTNVANVTDDSTLKLDRVIGVTTVTMNGQVYVIGASNIDSGVSVFKLVDDTNHEPTLTATGNNPAFTEGGAAADIYSAPVASTIEDGQTFTSLTLTVTNVTDGANEILSFLGNDLALTNGNSVAGVTVSLVGTTATVTFPGAADAAALQALIDDLAYRNASENPTEANRVITITQLTDSGGTAGSGDDTAALNIVSTVQVHRTNDVAIITGDIAGDVIEAGVVGNGTPVAIGDLQSIDVDNVNDAWQPVAAGAASANGYGTYQLTMNGAWTCTLANTNTAVQALNDGDTLIDAFSAVTADGSTQSVTITIHGRNDAAVVTGPASGPVIEAGSAAGTPVATGDLQSSDVDNDNDAWQAVAAGAASANGYGTYQLTAGGVWTYTLDNTNAAVQALKDGDTLADSFTVLTQDGTTQLVTIAINGADDAATISGSASGEVTEAGGTNNGSPGTPAATGNLDSTDVDGPNDAWSVVAPGTGSIGGYGTYQVTANGQWTYTVDNANAAVQALNGVATLIDTFNVTTADGATQLVTVTIRAQNDAAQISGDAFGAVVKSGTTTDSGDIDAADADNAADAWQAVAADAATANGYGTYGLTASGVWSYTLDTGNSAVQALKAGDTLNDTFTALTADGTAQLVTVTIGALNEAPQIDLNGAGGGTGAAIAFTEGGAPTPIVGISATISDANDPQLQSATIVLTNALAGDVLTVGNLAPFGLTSSIDTSVAERIAVTLGGAASISNYQAALQAVMFSSTSENPSTAPRHFEVSVSDGQLQSNTAIAELAVISINDAPVNVMPGSQQVAADHTLAIPGLAVSDADAGVAAITTSLTVAHGTLNVGALGGVGITGSGTGTVLLTGSVAQINAALGAAGNITYAPTHGFQGTDTLTMKTNDLGNTGNVGPLSDTDAIAINVVSGNTHMTGTTGSDSFRALPGNERIDAFGGLDTVTFDFRLVDAAVKHEGDKVIIDGPGSHTVLTGVERYVFTDGTVDNADNDVLVDDLFYYARNRDVWNAHADADAHYHAFGWHEGRDPNAFFSNATYLSLNPAVKASGVDPLVQFDQAGWKTGADPSIAFDVSAYLSANPDVKAAGVDPLAHFLQYGQQEGRQPLAPSVLLGPNGFDYVYYLQRNPDVAAAGIDPFAHFQQFGWKEGRDPNALFDTDQYLAAYGDVRAAGINPLDHYNQFGWREGRDPSVDFDTTDYLAHNPDVAAAQINPLVHFLQFGQAELRATFADGHFG